MAEAAVLVVEGIPGLSVSGGGITGFNLFRAIKKLYSESTLICLYNQWDSLGFVDENIRQISRECFDFFLGDIESSKKLSDVEFIEHCLNERGFIRNFDIFAYGHRPVYESIQIAKRRQCKLYSFYGDPLGAPSVLARDISGSSPVEDRIVKIPGAQLSFNKYCFNNSDFNFSFAAHHAAQMTALSTNTPHKYIRTPLCTIGEVKSRLEQREANVNTKCPKEHRRTLLLLGHISGSATQEGITSFYNDYLAQGMSVIQDAEISVIGGGVKGIPAEISRVLKSGLVSFYGPKRNIDKDLYESAALIVPTTVALGIRVRILTAFSYGLPVIAHISNAKGIPELVSSCNCLLYSSPEEFKEALIQIQNSDVCARIRRNAASLIMDCFSVEAIVKELSWVMH
jgi:glycosyltransferase involved in cell wall biosynthesis